MLKRRPPWRRRFRIGRSKTGLGLFALKPIRRGEFIAYYTGRLIANDEADGLWTKYLFEVNNRWTVDGSGRDNIARYINHSCKPNAETDVKGHKVIITAIRTIHPGDEITYNYGTRLFQYLHQAARLPLHGLQDEAGRASARIRKPPKREERLAKKRSRGQRLVSATNPGTPRSSGRP